MNFTSLAPILGKIDCTVLEYGVYLKYEGIRIGINFNHFEIFKWGKLDLEIESYPHRWQTSIQIAEILTQSYDCGMSRHNIRVNGAIQAIVEAGLDWKQFLIEIKEYYRQQQESSMKEIMAQINGDTETST